MSVIVETTIGDITIDLYIDERPRTSLNFLKLCKMKYYNHHLIFSVERDFIAQTGDPTGTGKGGESIFHFTYGDQARLYSGEKLPIMKHEARGTISMVSCGNMMFGSQFFVTLSENLDSLDEEHLVFGKVVEGMDVLGQLNQTLTDETKRPYKDIRITHTIVIHDPFPDPTGLQFPDQSPLPTEDMFTSNYIAADEDLDEDSSRDVEEIQEEIAAKEASARATILEMVGDIPDAEMAPPENVLFVCKLNPVTTSEDLEIIFSRFGRIVCVEVIRDKVTGNSLQYAFVEFADTKSCEDAFFKMDNVLIDERRVHVDFSQSVAKIKWKGKGRIEYFDDRGRKVSELPKSSQEQYSGSRKTGQINYSAPSRREQTDASYNRHKSSDNKKKFTTYTNDNKDYSNSRSSRPFAQRTTAKPQNSSRSRHRSSSRGSESEESSSEEADKNSKKRKKNKKKKSKRRKSKRSQSSSSESETDRLRSKNRKDKKERRKLIKQLKKELKKSKKKH